MQITTLRGFRLSPQQRRVWLLQQAEPYRRYQAQCVVRVEGRLDLGRLRSAMDQVVAQHEILRTSFCGTPEISIPVQVVAEQGDHLLRAIDLRRQPMEQQILEVEALLEAEGQAPAALERAAPLRVVIAQIADEQALLLVTLHALYADAATLGNLLNALIYAYTGLRAEDDSADPVQYADISEVFNDLLESEETEAGRQYWRLSDCASATRQGLLFIEPPSPDEHAAARLESRPGRLTWRLPATVTAQVLVIAEEQAVAPSVFYLACWALLLGRFAGSAAPSIAVAYDGRVYEGLDRALGLFARYLPVRCALDERSSFAQLLHWVHQAVAEPVEWQEYFSLESDKGAESFIPFAFSFVALPDPQVAAGLTFTIDRMGVTIERYTIQLAIMRCGDEWRAELQYDADAISAAHVQRIVAAYQALARDAAGTPQSQLRDLELLGDEERRLLLVEWNATTAPYPQDQCFHQLFAAQAARTPTQPAVVYGEQQYSYAELEAHANQLARELRELGVGPEARVGVCLMRGVDMLVALLGILKAGGAYVPLDPAYPPARLHLIALEAGVRVVVTQSGLRDRLARQEQDQAPALRLICLDTDWERIARLPPTAPVSTVRPENLAYIIYTSGSTGRPKGVMIQHRSMLNLAAALQRAIYQGRGPALRVSVNAPITFDGSVKQLVQLLYGHTLVIIPEEVRPDGAKLLDFVRRHHLDVLDCTPLQLCAMLAAGLTRSQPADDHASDPQLVLFGGEALDAPAWQQLVGASQSTFVNVYGPTECTVDATCLVVHDSASQPAIGRPIANVQVYLLNDNLRPAPVGVPGELCIGGAGVARGYLDRPDLTAERFIPNPFVEGMGDKRSAGGGLGWGKGDGSSNTQHPTPSTRLYRTGDLARHLPDGRIEFLGRLDQQVKVRGVRIELGEIESVLREHPSVQETVVLAREDVPGEKRLVAYVVTSHKPQVTSREDTSLVTCHSSLVTEWRAFLRERLPESMVPAFFVTLDRLPLTNHGKLDRQALPDPQDGPAAQLPYEAPRNQVERMIAAIWAEVLQVEKVGINANFFDLGGHSLVMVQVFDRLLATLGRPLTLVELFRYPTVSALAQHLGEEPASAAPARGIDERAERQKAARERQQHLMRQGRGIQPTATRREPVAEPLPRRPLAALALEDTLRQHPDVADVRVIPRVARDGEPGWLAYVVPRRGIHARQLGFSLFYFADTNTSTSADKYRLYREGARFADRHGFEAIWTPERHFHANGGLYPNPSVLSASLASITERVRLRAGSVALPLHHPLRVAEEWSVVDNLSGGRVDLSFTSGWIPNDFAIWPEPGVYQRKREVMLHNIELVQRLWSGGKIAVRDGVGKEVELEIFPKPIQPTLPIWITCSGDPEMFEKAGELGYNILTALLTMPLEEAAEKIMLYRKARARYGHDPDAGHVTLMMHTFIGDDEAAIRTTVQEPLTDYLQSHIGLMKTMAHSLNIQLDQIDINDPKWSRYLASFAFERYYRLGSLIGTPEKGMEMINRLKAMTVDEIACLIDFGVDSDTVLASLPHLHALKQLNDQTTLDHRTLDLFLHQQHGDAEEFTLVLVDTLPLDGLPEAGGEATRVWAHSS